MNPFQIVTTDNSWIRVSKEDESLLSKKWSFSNGYAKRYYEKTIDGKRVRWVEYLHRVISGAKDGEVVDHINGDRSDNRRSNIRITNKVINALNTGKTKGSVPYRGVSFNKKLGKYQAGITVDKKRIHLGTFSKAIEASKMYNHKQKEILSVI